MDSTPPTFIVVSFYFTDTIHKAQFYGNITLFSYIILGLLISSAILYIKKRQQQVLASLCHIGEQKIAMKCYILKVRIL